MPSLNVGDVVEIHNGSQYYGGGSWSGNPMHMEGEVIEVRQQDFCYRVRWANGRKNSYKERDLALVRAAPSTAKKAKKKTKTLNLPTRISMARKVIEERFNSHGSNGVAIHLKKQNLEPGERSVETGPCHGFIRNNGNKASEAIITLIDRTAHEGEYGGNQRDLGEEAVLAYYDWLFNRSPYAYIFLYKSAAHCWSRKTAVYRVDVPANMLQGALISTRNTWEHPDRIRVWHSLSKAGVEENLAFLLSGFFQQDRSGEIRFSKVVSDHHVLCNDISRQGARAFISGSPLFESALYNAGGEYGGVKRAWVGQGHPIWKDLQVGFNSFSSKGASVCRNPFIKAKASRQQDTKAMNTEEFVKFVATLSFD